MSEPLLLHSLLTFRAILFEAFAAVDPRRACEIGSESGGLTQELAEWAVRRDAEVWCIEPHPAGRVSELAAAQPAFHLVGGLSPAALADVPPCQVYVVDGDHNHATVRGELAAIAAATEDADPALVVLHDVGWPWARRDMYYDPSALAPGDVRPHSWHRGVAPGTPGLVDGGFRGEGSFAAAAQEGGPRNGVLTAVEDFLASHPDHELLVIPSVFGVGFLFPRRAPWADAVRQVVGPFHAHPLLEALERNRIALYLRAIELQDELAGQALRADRLVANLERRLGDAEAELARLRLERTRAAAGEATGPVRAPVAS